MFGCSEKINLDASRGMSRDRRNICSSKSYPVLFSHQTCRKARTFARSGAGKSIFPPLEVAVATTLAANLSPLAGSERSSRHDNYGIDLPALGRRQLIERSSSSSCFFAIRSVRKRLLSGFPVCSLRAFSRPASRADDVKHPKFRRLRLGVLAPLQ